MKNYLRLNSVLRLEVTSIIMLLIYSLTITPNPDMICHSLHVITRQLKIGTISNRQRISPVKSKTLGDETKQVQRKSMFRQ